MFHRMRAVWAGALALSLLAGGTVLAAPPAWAHANGASQASGQAGGQASSQADASTSSSETQGSGSQADFGSSVSQAVYAAHQAGESGTVLAAAIHEVLLAEHPNAKGLSVALAVYQHVYSNTYADESSSTFSDVDLEAPWAAAAINALQSAGVVNGTSSTTFTPSAPVTLAELATMLGRLQAGTASSTSSNPTDTPWWAQNGMAWTQQSGVLSGVQDLGSPNAPLTRAQAVLMLINTANLGAYADAESGATIDLEGTPPPWAHGAMALAVQLGLLKGSGGQLLADQPLTRAQMAVLLARLAMLEAEASSTSSSGS